MAARGKVIAAAALAVAVLWAGAGALTALLREPPSAAPVTTAVPAADSAPAPTTHDPDQPPHPPIGRVGNSVPPPSAHPAEETGSRTDDAAVAPADHGHPAPAPAASHGTTMHGTTTAAVDAHGPDPHSVAASGAAETDPHRHPSDDHPELSGHDDATDDDAAAHHAATAPAASHGAAPSHDDANTTKRRLVVIATGIAWNDELAAAALTLPPPVALALPADMEGAAARLAEWRAAGREVVLSFDWAHHENGGGAIPLDGLRELQAGRMEAQWQAHADAAAAVVIEPRAAAALRHVGHSLAVASERPVLFGAGEPASPPAAWLVDPARLGEVAFERTLARMSTSVTSPHGAAEGTIWDDHPETMVLLLTLYPGLMDRVQEWLGSLDAEGIELAPVMTLVDGDA